MPFCMIFVLLMIVLYIEQAQGLHTHMRVSMGSLIMVLKFNESELWP